MSLTRSLSTGASALRAQQQKFDVISNNISNANTVAYKSNNANFAEQFSQIYNFGKGPDESGVTGTGGIDPLQYGTGVKMGAVTKNMTQGTLESTGRPLDLALQGDGFFIYHINGNEVYSRASANAQDNAGFITDAATGAFLQGYNVDTDPATGKVIKDTSGNNQLNRKIESIKIPSSTLSEPRQTKLITMTGNLNSQSVSGDQRQTSINIYDNNGGVRVLGLSYNKTANANEWTVTATLDGNAVPVANNTILFNNDGSLKQPLSVSIKASDLNTANGAQIFDQVTPKDITIQLSDQNNILTGLTNFAMPNSATTDSQDGYQMGTLTGLNVDSQGKINGSFTNGQNEVLGQVVIAKFTNPEGLVKSGDNFFSTSLNSGLATVGTAGEIFPSSTMVGGSLEQSNVDLTTQFTDMISAQRAFEAASRTITVSDQMLSDVNQLKR